MIPKRVFSPSLTVKSLTSENRLKGNPQFDCETSNSNTGAIKKQQLTTAKPIKSVEFIEPTTTKDNNATNAIPSNDRTNNQDNSRHSTKFDGQTVYRNNGTRSECEHLPYNSCQRASKLNNAQIERIIDNIIGTTETVLVEENHRYELGNSLQQCVPPTKESTEIGGLSVKRFVAETTINNVPLRDVIQRKVSKLSNQLLHSNRENSTKPTNANAQPKQFTKTKRSLFRRKTTAITKDQVEAARNLNQNCPKTSNNKPIIEKIVQVKQTASIANDNNNRHRSDTYNIGVDESQRKHQQIEDSALTKQKQTNNVTIATPSHFVDRKDTKAPHKNCLNEAQQRNQYGVSGKTSQFDHFDANDGDNNRFDSTKFTGCFAPKQCFSKQLPTANKLKSEIYTSHHHSTSIDAVNTKPSYSNVSSITKIIQKPLPPPYIDPPVPSTVHRTQFLSKQTSHFTSKLQKTNKNKNKLENDIKNSRHIDVGSDDDHGNYAIPYESIDSECASPTAAEPIRIANQQQQQQKPVIAKITTSTTRKQTNTKKTHRQHNRSVFVLQQKIPPAHDKGNADSANDKSHIVCVYGRDNVNELILFDTIDPSTSTSSECSNSSSGNSSSGSGSGGDSSGTSCSSNEPNVTTNPISDKNIGDSKKMDPMAISNLTSPCDMLTKPEFSSSHLQNIPVRPRKGIPHLENYCLFDPSKDFLNEKELKRKFGLVNGDCMPFPITILDKRSNEDELVKETAYEEQDLVYDTLEDVKEEDEEMGDGETSFPNYFTIDPDYIEQNKMEKMFGNANHLQPIVESETEDIYSDSNANLNKVNAYENYSITSTAVPLKKSPQIEKIVRQASQPIITTFTAKKMAASLKSAAKMELFSSSSSSSSTSSSSTSKNRDMKIILKNRTKINPPTDLPLRTTCQPKMPTKKRNSFTMKHSVSTPQLSLKDLLADNAALPVIEIDMRNAPNTAAPYTANRLSQYKVRRPTSQHSDADSGFLSPATPPDAFTQSTQHTLFPHCDSLQGYIDVSRLKQFSHFVISILSGSILAKAT